jgi:hypothetical protein
MTSAANPHSAGVSIAMIGCACIKSPLFYVSNHCQSAWLANGVNIQQFS